MFATHGPLLWPPTQLVFSLGLVGSSGVQVPPELVDELVVPVLVVPAPVLPPEEVLLPLDPEVPGPELLPALVPLLELPGPDVLPPPVPPLVLLVPLLAAVPLPDVGPEPASSDAAMSLKPHTLAHAATNPAAARPTRALRITTQPPVGFRPRSRLGSGQRRRCRSSGR
jgi:hypothetical protein